MKSKTLFGIPTTIWLIWLSVIILAIIFSFTPAHQSIENKLQDLRFYWRTPIPISDQITHIDIDDSSREQLGRWPWTRDIHAKLVDTLTRLDAKAVAFDVDFFEPTKKSLVVENLLGKIKSFLSQDRQIPAIISYIDELYQNITTALDDDDIIFAQAVSHSGRTYLTVNFPKDPPEKNRTLPAAFLSGVTKPPIQPLGREPYKYIIVPLDALNEGVKGLGYVDIEPDTDGILRRVALVKEYEGHFYPQLAFRVICEALNIPLRDIIINPGKNVILTAPDKNQIIIPIDKQGKVQISWADTKNKSWDKTFNHISYAHIVNGISPALQRIEESKQNSDISPVTLRDSQKVIDEITPVIKDKICLVGMVATANTDMKPTPNAPMVPGVMLHSNLMNMILTDNFVHQSPRWLNILIMLLCGGLVIFFASRFNPLISSTATLAVIALSTVMAFVLFSNYGISFDLTSPIIVSFFGFASIAAYRTVSEEKAKRQVQGIFGHYLSPHVVNELLQNPDKVKLGGEKRVMTVFFSDIENFTNSTSGLTPEVLTEFVNKYLTAMTDIIQTNDGMIDKYEGDAIMALFGAPVTRPDHAKLACWAALDQYKKLTDLNAYYKKANLPLVNIRVGINSGEMVVGNLGSSKVLSYTVMGEEVILANRLEGVNKFYDTRMLISEGTYQMAKQFIDVREIDSIRAKGMKKAVRIFELLARKGEADAVSLELITQYAIALQFYRNRQWNKAIEYFNNCLKIKPDDGPSITLLDHCLQYKSTPPDDKWGGINTLTAK